MYTSSFDIVIAVLVIILIVILLIIEYRDHDCIPGKRCTHYVLPPKKDDSPLEYIDKIERMVVSNYLYVSWRLSLLAALIVTFPVIYFMRGRLPNLIEWLVVGGLIFLSTYLAFSWIWAHFFYPNGKAIESHLLALRDKIAV